jgi:tRNA(Leu) C34 or U34 (ribose-2'-O)-methylase TrmL
VGVTETCEDEIALATVTLLKNSTLTEIDLSAYTVPKVVKKAYATASGTYVFELHAAGYGINGEYFASGKYIVIQVAIADGITDPYNLGALIRCAEGLGAHGLILPKRRAVGLTPLVSKASAGAIEHLPVAKVANLAQTVEKLQKLGVWVYAAEAGGQSYDKTNLKGPCALIFGSEGDGVSALLKQKCDAIISIPMRGQVNSLNVSTAAAILLAEAARQHAEARES